MQAAGQDWQNSYAAFVTGLKRELSRIENDAARDKAIADMRKVLDSYAHFRADRHDRTRGKGHRR